MSDFEFLEHIIRHELITQSIPESIRSGRGNNLGDKVFLRHSKLFFSQAESYFRFRE